LECSPISNPISFKLVCENEFYEANSRIRKEVNTFISNFVGDFNQKSSAREVDNSLPERLVIKEKVA
jgi:hypothetical protein